MKKWERVVRQVLYQFYERNERFMNQRSIAEVCGLSLGSVHPVMKKLNQLGAVKKKPQGFRVVDVGRIIMYWANTRDLAEDFILKLDVGPPVEEIERNLPKSAILTAYSAFKSKFGGPVERYREVYVYSEVSEIKKRFGKGPRGLNSIVVLKPDEHLAKVSPEGVAPFGQVYVDLWQLGTPAKSFIDNLNTKMRLVEMGTLKGVIRRTRERA